jgi:Uncharacterized conserved protein
MKELELKMDVLEATFLYFKGIREKKEKDLWKKGITNWRELEKHYEGEQLTFLDEVPYDSIHSRIKDCRNALKERKAEFFSSILPKREYYRIATAFYPTTIFMDIETTGLSKYYDYTTLVGWCINGKYNYYIKGDDDTTFRNCLASATCIVTFNGTLFDIPFLLKDFPGVQIPKIHVDLRFLSRRVGLSGGQKAIEDRIGVVRPAEIENVQGKTAPLLWYKFFRGNIDSLKLLIKYNYFDVYGLQSIFNSVINLILEKNEFPSKLLPIKIQNDFLLKEHYGLEIPDNLLKKKRHKIRRSISSFTLDKLANKKDYQNYSIVGIDLTGSEARPTGFCFLQGNIAYTSLISTDTELINATIKAKPVIVSIDSPLSLPIGRISVFDDDPGRKKYGIMRVCERILKKRGINVYPSLIPSMQKLTMRGIKLATELRALGIPVIESFPGAAQDILGIPRKRADLTLLKDGLAGFGIKGDFIRKAVSHDEVDAITSAIVGYFFWFGKFEALGNFDEDYLIIPDISKSIPKWQNTDVFGLSGAISAGKTTTANYIQEKGYSYTRFSLILAKELEEKGESVNRRNLQVLGDQIFKNGKQRWLCKKVFQSLPSPVSKIVIDGLRHPEDYAFLVESFGPSFRHLFINTNFKIRKQRYLKHSKSNKIKDFESAINHPVERDIEKLKVLAYKEINNSGTLKTLYGIIDKEVKTIKRT